MASAEMSRGKTSDVPTPFRGLRVLLVDNDTSSLLNIASELEDYSYRVTTTELATVALSILQERKDRFHLVMADTNMPEMDLINFINNVHLIKDLPIILMSSDSDKDTVKEAVIKGACFFLEKPISSKNLKNVWQHAYRKRRYQEARVDIKTNSDGGAKIEQDDEEEEEGDKDLKITKESTLQENKSEEIGDSDQVDNNLDNLSSEGKKPTKLAGIRTKRSAPTENDGPQEVIKRKRTKSWGGPSHIQLELSTMMANATEKLELMSELASSSKSLDRKQFRASVRANKGKVEESGAQCSAERKGQMQL